MNNQDYLDKLKILPSECSCEICKRMCHAPCCGSVEDFEKLIDEGFAHRLMFDNLPSILDGGNFLKPALKGHEGKQAPWQTRSLRGCTFWNESGKCDLHNKGLKPLQGKIANHSEDMGDKIDLFAEISKEDWESERGLRLIDKWKKLVNYEVTVSTELE